MLFLDSVRAWFIAVRTFAIVFLVLSIVSLAYAGATIRAITLGIDAKINRNATVASGLCIFQGMHALSVDAMIINVFFLALVFAFGLITFAAMYSSELQPLFPNADLNLGYSYFLCWVAAAKDLIAAGLFLWVWISNKGRYDQDRNMVSVDFERMPEPASESSSV